jgi:hypothetical protein
MAITLAKWTGDFPVKCNRPEAYMLILQFETADTAAPDGLDPSVTGVTLGRTGVGDLTVTFAEDIKPNKVLACFADFVEDDPENHVKYTGYTKATGVLTLTTYSDLIVAGTEAADDLNNQTVQLVIWATRSEMS